jgi:hypothetical protein
MTRLEKFAPVVSVALAAVVYLGGVFLSAGGDPLVFAYLGTRYGVPDPAGTEGYDGQFNYYIAVNPDPHSVGPHLDVPAYRYQHILYPLLARILALGAPCAIPWTLVGINLFCFSAFVFLAGELVAQRGGSRWAAVLIGLWVGLMGSIRLDLAEPLALLLVALALWIAGPDLERRIIPATFLLALAVLAKETVLPFLAGWIAWLIFRRRFRKAACLALAVVPFAILQLWLWRIFGAPGLGSGGAGATSFEFIPFAGLFRITEVSLRAFAALSIVYLPGLLLPAVYGLIAPLIDFVKKRAGPEAWLLWMNALMIAFAPFSTFREPLGVMRLACGLILCLWLYAARNKIQWWSKLGLVGLAYLPFLR